MKRCYQVAGLRPGIEIVEDVHVLRVNISEALQRPFAYNDEEILATHQKGEYIWVSGGGTWLLNNKYLLIVQRAPGAKINPGKFSLFTGRADNMGELLYPESLVRELFEELILFTDHQLYKPDCEIFSETIDHIYAKLVDALELDIAKARPLLLNHLLCTPKKVVVTDRDTQWEGELDFHISSNGEVNILFVLAGDVDVEKLQAMDGEYHLKDGKVVRQNRSIYIYDLHTSTGKDITIGSSSGEMVSITDNAMTEHLRCLVESVKRKLVTDKPNQRSPLIWDQVQHEDNRRILPKP